MYIFIIEQAFLLAVQTNLKYVVDTAYFVVRSNRQNISYSFVFRISDQLSRVPRFCTFILLWLKFWQSPFFVLSDHVIISQLFVVKQQNHCIITIMPIANANRNQPRRIRTYEPSSVTATSSKKTSLRRFDPTTHLNLITTNTTG